VSTPLHDPVTEITERVYEEFEVLHTLDEPQSMPTLQQELDYATTELQDIVSRLEFGDCICESQRLGQVLLKRS